MVFFAVCMESLSFAKMVKQLLVAFLWTVLIAQLKACPMGYYGHRCRNECSMTCLSMMCNATTGKCLDGCKNGYVGDRCNEVCQSGFYGGGCLATCPSNCLTNACDHVTGECKEGCKPGYEGDQCHDTCNEGSYGEGCGEACSVNCVSSLCHHSTGHCLEGCKENYWGSDCSLLGEFKSNSEPQKVHFYQSLSAESRSVLLYLLMGNYENTLERAQLEIRKGIRQRNEIRELISGDSE